MDIDSKMRESDVSWTVFTASQAAAALSRLLTQGDATEEDVTLAAYVLRCISRDLELAHEELDRILGQNTND